ncbi:hypothetical protein J3E69DRAFT_321849 [Trichoderma sp. SZMC 28015]
MGNLAFQFNSILSILNFHHILILPTFIGSQTDKMKFNNLITCLILHLSFVTCKPVDLNDIAAVDVRGLEPRTLNIVGETAYYCWAASSATLANAGYSASLDNLHTQMFHFFNVIGNVEADEFLFTSTRNNGVIWTAKVIVVATTQAFTIADAINDLYNSLTQGTGVHVYKGGTAAVSSVVSATVGTLIEMISMTNGGSSYSVLKRDEDLAARASCGSGTEYFGNCCRIEID